LRRNFWGFVLNLRDEFNNFVVHKFLSSFQNRREIGAGSS
jgi:hypothetical protein